MTPTLSAATLQPLCSLSAVPGKESHQPFLQRSLLRHFYQHYSHPCARPPCSSTSHRGSRSLSEDSAANALGLHPTKKMALLSRLCSEERLEEALNLLLEIESSASSIRQLPDVYTYNKLLSLYAKLGRLDEAHQLFGRMRERNEVSWSSIIAASTRCGNFSMAFDRFQEMMAEGIPPREFALGSLIKASAGLADAFAGKQLHGLSIRRGFVSDIWLRTSLVTMYSTCGFLEDAELVFEEGSPSSHYDAANWNSMISAYASHGRWSECLHLFEDMIWTGIVSPTEPTYVSMINACCSTRAQDYGCKIHGKIAKDGLRGKTRIENSLVSFYAKCGNMEDAFRMFHTMSRKNLVSWNALVSGYEQNGSPKDAVDLFRRMLESKSGLTPNHITFLSILSAISALLALKLGIEVHAQVIKLGIERDAGISNSLITMYAKCGKAQKARLVFQRLVDRDIVSWNSMLAGYSQNEQLEDCLILFRQMMFLGIEPDDHTITIVLGALSLEPSTVKFRRGREIHGFILRHVGTEGIGVSRYNAIITIYAKCNRLIEAQMIFKGMQERDS